MKEDVDPQQFVITRRRKKYKFAKFHNAKNCFEYEEWLGQRSQYGISYRQPDTLEIGAGTGLFSVELAARYPQRMFVAVDVKADRLQRGAYVALERGLHNIAFVRARADQLTELFAPHSLATIWVTFPDPFPKKRSAGRRLTHSNFLAMYQKLLINSGRLHLKHDNCEFFCWSLEQIIGKGWRILELTFDVHNFLPIEHDACVETTYEKRWRTEGLKINYVEAVLGNLK